MTDSKSDRTKKIILVCLLALCAFLVYRNVIAPGTNSATGSAATVPTAPNGAARQTQNNGARNARSSSRRESVMDKEELAALDPTLRLDLIEKTMNVTYKGNFRSIFQFYTPPPKPIASPVVAPPIASNPGTGSQQQANPPAPSIALKFYGTSNRPGTNEKKAFLTDGDQIYIGQEGDIVAKRYKIVRIGLNVLDWQDTQSQQSGQLPLLQE